jgi:hypothetical protein
MAKFDDGRGHNHRRIADDEEGGKSDLPGNLISAGKQYAQRTEAGLE